MKLTLLGTGAAAGLPLYGCDCTLCQQAHNQPAFARSPCSALLQLDDQQWLIDAGQMNLTQRFAAGTLDSILLTHFHPDHVQGLFHLRWGKAPTIPVYCPPDQDGCADLFKHPGMLAFTSLQPFMAFTLGPIKVTPLPLTHSKPTFGYGFEYQQQRFAYLTDTKGLPADSLRYLVAGEWDTVVVDCSHEPGNPLTNHNNLDDVLNMAKQIKSRHWVLTHIGHEMDRWLQNNSNTLPSHFIVGRDNMTLTP